MLQPIPALRKGEMTTLHNCTEDTECLPQHRDKHSIPYLSRRNKYAFQRVQGQTDEFARSAVVRVFLYGEFSTSFEGSG